MKKSLITILRDKNTDMATFRSAAKKMTHILAVEALDYIKEKKISVATPFKKTTGHVIGQDVILVPILRSGIAFLETFLFYFENARVGFMGLRRDEKTAVAKEYYRNLPKVKKDTLVIILDPMIATGGSAVDTLRALREAGVREKQMLFVALISAPEGLQKIKKEFPKLRIIVGTKDKKLNKEKFILPGIGDFGDRYFGTI